MINKKLVALTGAATLGLALIPLTSIAADNVAGTLNSYAYVGFTVDNSPKKPLDPNDPVKPDGTQTAVTPDSMVPGKNNMEGTSGPLSIDFASSFNFGEKNILSSGQQRYFAKAQDYFVEKAQPRKQGPLFVQVTDVREGEAKGWKLQVKRTEFKTADAKSEPLKGEVLKGVELKISNGNVLDGQNAVSPAGLSPTATTGDVLISDTDANVMTAGAGQGHGSWLYRMGSKDKDTSGTSVTLTIPANTTLLAQAYTATLTWTLTDGTVQ